MISKKQPIEKAIEEIRNKKILIKYKPILVSSKEFWISIIMNFYWESNRLAIYFMSCCLSEYPTSDLSLISSFSFGIKSRLFL